MSFNIIPLPEFEKQVKVLSKKYRNIGEDLKSLRTILLKNPKAGDPIPGLEGKVYKIRLASSDMQRGKRGGFRIIYYFVDDDENIFLLTIYAKP